MDGNLYIYDMKDNFMSKAGIRAVIINMNL